ncbi:MAG: endonuclease/exonuclease/phosphatase family protein [Desulfatibacillaceae bacterium]|nr:endonuclease/exonuclease/phosphatase family protein [Desulfatibacillaceae bacterium]
MGQHSGDFFSVLTLNLRFGLADDGPNCWDCRKASLPGLFAEYGADFICTQETNDFQARHLHELLPDYEMLGLRRPAPQFWQNNLIFAKKPWKTIAQRRFYLSPTPDIPSRFKGSRWPRQCSLGLFENKGKTLVVAVTHLDFDSTIQTRSAEIILEALKKLALPDAPVLLTGDFNAKPGSPVHSLLLGKNAKSPAAFVPFTDVFEENDMQGTHHSFTGRADREKGRIDWILHRGGLAAEKTLIIEKKFANFFPSDHFPVWALFSLKNISY